MAATPEIGAERRGRAARELPLWKKLLFAVLPTALLLGGAELALRWTGAADRCPGYRDNILWVCDPLLYFRINPAQVIEGRPLNRAGFRSAEFEPRVEGATRVLALGDSCTYGLLSPDQTNGLEILSEPYPQKLQRLADERLGPGRLEVLNAGVPGYNTYQGLLLLRGKLRGLRPDVITIRYGWNDLAMAREQAFGNAFVESDSAVARFLENLLLRTKLYPFARRLGMEMRARSSATNGSAANFPDEWRPNVPLALYERNLRRLVDLGRAQGAEVWLLTSPDPFATPEDLARYAAADERSNAHLTLAVNGVPTFERLVEIHDEYNEVVRRVAAETGAPLVDMAALYGRHPAADLFAAGDVIHPTDAGHTLEAEALLALLRGGEAPPTGTEND